MQLELFCLQLSFFAYNPLRPLLDALSYCKQKSSNCKQKAKIVGKKTPIVSKKPKSSTVSKKKPTVSRKLPTVSKKLHPQLCPTKVLHKCVSLKESPLNLCNPQAHNPRLNRANLYENEIVKTYRGLNCSGASPN